MAEPKSFASLTSGLLARKGSAQPAMRRQPIAGFGGGASSNLAAHHEDLGWNDMGHDAPPPADIRPHAGLTPMASVAPAIVPPVVTERVELARRVARTHKSKAARPVATAGALARKAAFTLRLDSDRHLRLRLACALQGRSAQQIVTDALDAFLNSQPEVERLAGQLPRRRGTN
ncbi:hypothetical protein WG908_00705 [Sphingobium sp. AN641]|uniref:hypothetical protein n=1 Tax=Sphingobium sp. AN641 TaxID=3133443 RepID=UPI0030C27350